MLFSRQSYWLQGFSDCRRTTRSWCTPIWRPWSTRPGRPARSNRRPCCSGWASWADSSRRPGNSRSYCPCRIRQRRTRRQPISAASRRGTNPKYKTLRPRAPPQSPPSSVVNDNTQYYYAARVSHLLLLLLLLPVRYSPCHTFIRKVSAFVVDVTRHPKR